MEHEIKEKKTISVVTERYTTCDKCGLDVTSNRVTDHNDFESFFKLQIGDTFPESGETEIKQIDLCEVCAPIALKLLSDNGFKPYTTKNEY